MSHMQPQPCEASCCKPECIKPVVSCGRSAPDTLDWTVAGADEAWIETTCFVYYGPLTTRTDISLDGSGNATGAITKVSGCTYRIVAKNECGESSSECCGCQPSPDVSFRILGLLEELAVLNDVYSVSRGDIGNLVVINFNRNDCPGKEPTAIAAAIKVAYNDATLKVTAFLTDVTVVGGYESKVDFTLFFDPDNECPTNQASTCKLGFERFPFGGVGPFSCAPSIFNAQIEWL